MEETSVIKIRVKFQNHESTRNESFLNYSIFNENGFDLSLIECGYEKCEPDHSWEGVKGFHILHFVLSGSGKLELNGTVYDLKAGDGFYIPFDKEARYWADHDTPWEYRWLGLMGVRAVSFVNRLELNEKPVFHMTREQLAEYDAALKGVYEDAIGETEYGEYLALGRVYSLLGSMLSHYGVYDTKTCLTDEYIQRAVMLIKENYASQFEINDLCRELHLSRSYLYKIFMKRFKMPPSAYLLKFRLQKARDILENGSCEIGLLAEKCGFNSHAYFSKCFREQYGVPPREYMLKHKGDSSK